MKKIIIVTRSLNNKGGIETALLNFIEEIHKFYEIDLFAFSLSKDYRDLLENKVNFINTNFLIEMLGSEQKQYKKTNFCFYVRAILVCICRIFGNTFIIKSILKTKRLKKEYDLGISYMQAARKHTLSDGNNQFVLSNIHAKLKVVVIHSDYEYENFNEDYHNKLYECFDKIITVSINCRNKIIKCVPEFKEKVFVLHNFYAFNKIITNANSFIPDYDFSKKNFVTVARLTPEKGLLRMIDVVNELKEKKDFIWHIVGDGKLKNQIEKKINQLNLQEYIRMHGVQDNPYPFIYHADLLIVCSLYEAAPMVIGEAQILNTPVLSTNTLSANEQIKDGITGIVCDNNINGLYMALLDIMKNPNVLKSISYNLNKITKDNSMQLKEFQRLIE